MGLAYHSKITRMPLLRHDKPWKVVSGQGTASCFTLLFFSSFHVTLKYFMLKHTKTLTRKYNIVIQKFFLLSPFFPNTMRHLRFFFDFVNWWWTHRWRINQLFYNIFNPMEIFFLEGFVCWACTIGIWSTLAQLNLSRQIYKLCYKLHYNIAGKFV